ncbi:MAG: hypothetical protein IJY15_08800, partial [Thermoguttaceae bacterium]|nr:hypothetical protein [Thermoguttaceae bacterium]
MRWNSLLILMTSCALATGAGAFETTASTAGVETGNAAAASAGFAGFNGFTGVGNEGGGDNGGPVVDVDS